MRRRLVVRRRLESHCPCGRVNVEQPVVRRSNQTIGQGRIGVRVRRARRIDRRRCRDILRRGGGGARGDRRRLVHIGHGDRDILARGQCSIGGLHGDVVDIVRMRRRLVVRRRPESHCPRGRVNVEQAVVSRAGERIFKRRVGVGVCRRRRIDRQRRGDVLSRGSCAARGDRGRDRRISVNHRRRAVADCCIIGRTCIAQREGRRRA